MFSGHIAAYSYHRIASEGFADVFIILGPNHKGIGSGVSMEPRDAWETPLGVTPIDKPLVEQLKGGIIDLDEVAHSIPENSIEVQLPFLQYIKEPSSFSIIPIAMAMQDLETSKEVGDQLAEAIEAEDRRIVIIASSDFSHEGAVYGRSPPRGKRIDEYVREKDKLAIQQIEKIDPDALIKTVYREDISMCGYGPVAALLQAAKKLGCSKAELLKYGTSYDVSPESEACVGYG
ncbi:MAG TPA: AmmeMemoRadiSam system protein B, partial [Thermoplasmatales archaeon]|nr:AmmeMemoRadiSam system protein B [Thermoplasmatales archaeon]